VKAPASVSRAKSNRDAPMSAFIVSDDDIDLSDRESLSDDESDDDIEYHDCASPLQLIPSISNKENRPIVTAPEDSDKVSRKPKCAVKSNSDTALADLNTFLKPGIVELLLDLSPVFFPLFCYVNILHNL